MSEIKRVALNTLEPQKVSDKVIKKTCKTVRISVILPESNEDNCPEYNYKDQLAAVKRKNKQHKDSNHVENGLDPFGEDNDDVRRIALEMEAKYGSGVTDKKKRKGRKDDYADIGMGYDESDSFIDNTDGYDEIIPQNVTTLHGGFYINCGALEFKTDDEANSHISSSSSDSETEEKRPKNRKRVLDTSEDDSDSDTAKNTTQAEKKLKLHSDKNMMQHAIKKKLFSQNKIQIKKRRPIDPLKKTVKELLREKREDLDMSIPPDLEKEDNLEKDSSKENKKPMSISSVTDAIESVVKQVGDVTYDSNQNTHILDVPKSAESPSNKYPSEPPSLTMDGESSQDQTEKKELVKLPENIPSDILEIVNKIKQAALDYRDEGKKKFFSQEVNSYLLNLEKKCRILGKSSRLRIYDYLSYFCKVRKETLIRRARILLTEEEELRLKKLTNKLKDCVSASMPALIANFELESQKLLAKKFSSDISSEESKNLKFPKRRFIWNDESKKLLKDSMSAKKKCLLLEGKQKNNLEELLVTFLRNSILPLWPEGWMYLNNLKKVYNSMTETSKIINTTKPNSNSTLDVSCFKETNVDRSSYSSVDKSNLDLSNVDKSTVDKPNVDDSMKSIAPKHSNLTITPVEVASNIAKADVPNSVTVTKIAGDVSTNSNKVATETATGSSNLLKKMFDEIVKSSPEEIVNSPLPSTERSKPEKDYTRTKVINLDTPPSKSSKHNPEGHKPQAERVLATEQKNHWPNELYAAHKEQSAPADYSSKHSSKHNEEKIDINKHSNASKSIWPSKEPWSSEEMKSKTEPTTFSRHSEMISSKHSSTKHPKINDNSKPISLSVNDLLQKNEKLIDSSKHHSESSRHHPDISKPYTESSKHYTDSSKHYSDSSKHYTDGTKHYESSKHRSDSSKRYSDSKHHSDSSKHHMDSSKHLMDNSKHHSDNSKHHYESSKHSRAVESLKLPCDNNVIVLNANQSKELDSKQIHKEELKSLGNPVISKSMHCQLMDLTDGRTKLKMEDSKTHKYSSSSSAKDLPRSDVKSSKSSSDLLPSNYFSDPMKMSHKYPEFSTGSNFLSSTPNKMGRSDGDNEIQMVMENLKALQKLSCSPVKNDSTSSPVSVIAFNKNFTTPKTSSSNQSNLRISDTTSNKSAEFTGTFQDDFQKQFINSIQMSANPSTTNANYRCS